MSTQAPMTPAQVLDGLQVRDKHVRENFYRSNREDVYSLCCHFLGPGDSAAKITADLFEQIIREPPGELPEGGLIGDLKYRAIVACVDRVLRLQIEFKDLGEAINTVHLPPPKTSSAGDQSGRMRRKIIKTEKEHINSEDRILLDQLEEDKTINQLALELNKPIGEILEQLVPARTHLKERVEKAAGEVSW